MLRRFSLLLSGTALALLLLLAFDNTVQAGRGGGGGGGGRGGGGGGRGGGGFGGGGRGGFGAGRGGFGGGRGGFGGGFGRGGFGRGGFGGGGFGGGWGYGGWGWGGWGYGGWGGWGLYWPYYGYYQPYYGDSVYGVYAAPGYDAAAYVDYATAAPANGSITLVAQKPPGGDRRPDDTASCELKLPENAELWINGTKYPQAGKLQEVVTPTLTPGKKYAYMIDVHVKDSTGKESVDRRKIRFRANDWVSIDLTRPAPTVIAGPAPLPVEEKAN